MRVLALDTTTRAGSTALVEDDRIVDERGGDGQRTHALRLPAEVTELARAHGWALTDVDLYAVASGPGSFTGLRIGIATIQGLASVHGRRVVPIPALEAMAHVGSVGLNEGTLIAAWMDAHRRDVFAALYRVTAASPFRRARLIEVDGAAVGTPGATLARWRASTTEVPAVFIGDGAALNQAEIERYAPASTVLPLPQIAGAVGRLAVDRAAEALTPAQVRPLYVRRPDVELTRDERPGAANALSKDA
jgi:tRNA threonylcarbamoyladenosine biosynthesis protein TsaB